MYDSAAPKLPWSRVAAAAASYSVSIVRWRSRSNALSRVACWGPSTKVRPDWKLLRRSSVAWWSVVSRRERARIKSSQTLVLWCVAEGSLWVHARSRLVNSADWLTAPLSGSSLKVDASSSKLVTSAASVSSCSGSSSARRACSAKGCSVAQRRTKACAHRGSRARIAFRSSTANRSRSSSAPWPASRSRDVSRCGRGAPSGSLGQAPHPIAF